MSATVPADVTSSLAGRRPRELPLSMDNAALEENEPTSQVNTDERIVIIAPVGQDAAAMAALLDAEGFVTWACKGMEEGSREICAGAGVLLLTEEALESPQISNLLRVLKDQPRWSELPLVILTSGGKSRLTMLLDLVTTAAGTVILLERPLSGRTLVRSVEVALRSRQRQYQVRNLIRELAGAREDLQRHAARLEETVAERTCKLNETIHELEGFSYSIAHDMRAPLRAMRGYASLLNEEFGSRLNDVGKKYLERIGTSAERLDNLIQDVLNYTRVLRGDIPLTDVDAEKLLREIIESYPNLQRPDVTIELVSPLPLVRANPAALTQVFSNLLGNAVKFVALGVRPHVKVYARTAPENNSVVRFWFEDNGIGMDQESKGRIFQMFQRLNHSDAYEGTGIGLAIVRKAAERMGGKTGVESELGKGSRFWVELKGAANGEPGKPR